MELLLRALRSLVRRAVGKSAGWYGRWACLLVRFVGPAQCSDGIDRPSDQLE